MKTEIPEIYLVPMPGRVWRVAITWEVHTRAAGFLRIPRGFMCDMNSIPRMLWWASTPTDYPEAGVTHDWLYSTQRARAIADCAYLELLMASGMSAFRAHARYRALRLFGGFAYRKHAQANKGREVVPAGTPHTDELPNLITGNTPESTP